MKRKFIKIKNENLWKIFFQTNFSKVTFQKLHLNEFNCNSESRKKKFKSKVRSEQNVILTAKVEWRSSTQIWEKVN